MLVKSKFILLGLLALLFTGCSDEFLELESKTSQNEANYYKTESDAMNALTSVYDALSTQNWQYVPIMSDIWSDDAFAGGSDAGDMAQWQVLELSQLDAENDAVTQLWNRTYSGIYRANLFLEKADNINWINEARKDRMIAEAKFLRAYFYWDLARHFGWVPIITEVLPDVSSYREVDQAEPVEVYQQIAEDLLDAIEVLPEQVPDTEVGRATKYAAQALMARIYLFYDGFGRDVLGFNQEWTDGETTIDEAYVEDALDEIINSGAYHLLENYRDVFAWDNENNAESIFEWQYSEKSGVTDWGGWGINGNFAVIFYGPRNPDGDPEVAPGWSFGIPTWSLVDAYEPGDERLNTVIYNADDSLSDYLHAFQNTGFFNYKYMPRAAYDAIRGERSHNYPINYKDIRFADVLLMAAELHLDDDPALAQKYYNIVRKRAFGPDYTPSTVTLDRIFEERRLEFGGEGLRKWDLMRRGLDYAKEKIDASFNVPEGAPNEVDFQGRFFDPESWGMFPIPAREIRNVNEGVLNQFVPAFQ
ncbi:MAG: RagB/SusD family nutrient uptake outer membrane protein [Candidatus Cyclobacteriaceae bacterium M3_2C_046]